MNKNTIHKAVLLTLGLGSMLSFSSCKKYLDVENASTVSQDAVFESVSYTQSALIGVYNKLMGDDGYGSRISILYPMAADDFKTSGDYNPLDRRGLSGYGAKPGNSELDKPFLQLYQGIERANICIKYIPASSLYTSGTAAEKATMRKFYGEALTLRAQFYHELIRNWGDLPAHMVPASDLPNLFLPKTDRDTIYDQLLADLEVASGLVPWRSESGDPSTRITKGAVKGLRARIALARGGYSLRRKESKYGQVMAAPADARKFYEIANKECKDIIEKGDHNLNPSFENLFRTLHGGARQDPGNEWIFEAGAFGGNARTDSKLGYGNGVRMDASSSYGQANGGVTAIPTYYYEFDSIGDSRRDVTIVNFEVDKTDNKVITAAIDMRDGKYRKYWTSIKGPNQTLGINWPILRYADVLLMFAETENMLNDGPTSAAKTAYEDVRRRAFVGYESRMGTTPTDKDEFFNAIVKERLLEFGGEGVRKYDLIRWNLLFTTIKDTRAKLTAFMNGTGRYANVPDYIYVIPNKLKNGTVPEEIADFNLANGPVSKAMFSPVPTPDPSSAYTKKNWRKAVTLEYVSGDKIGFARYFEENSRELFPLYSGVLNQNYNLKQDYGY